MASRREERLPKWIWMMGGILISVLLLIGLPILGAYKGLKLVIPGKDRAVGRWRPLGTPPQRPTAIVDANLEWISIAACPCVLTQRFISDILTIVMYFLLLSSVIRGTHMSAAAVETIAQQIERLAPEEKWALLSILIDSLRHQAEPARRSLCDYYGAAKGRGFRTAQEVDAYIQEERASWER